MKRIKAACLQQILHFSPKEGTSPQYAAQAVQEEVDQYKARLDKVRTQYRILREEVQADGTMILEIKKQYNTSPVGDFLN